MNDAVTAQAVGAGHDNDGHFVYVARVTNTYDRPDLDIDVMHAEFFECHTQEETPPRFIGQGPHPPVRVTKNVYNLTPIFIFGAGLVVNQHIRDTLASCCTVEFREVRIVKAFWFPYGPGDRSFELACVSLADRKKEVVNRFAAAYACRPPEEVYYDIIVHTGYRRRRAYPDTRILTVGGDVPEGLSVYPGEAEVSRRMIEEHGLVFSCGYLCRPDVFELLNPYLHRPWFWCQRYLYPTST